MYLTGLLWPGTLFPDGCFSVAQKFMVIYFILLDHICPGEDNGLSVSQKFGRYPTSNLGYDLSYSDFLTLSNSEIFGHDPSLTNDLSYSTISTPLSNAWCVTLYYDSTFENHFLFCISYLPCLLAEQQSTVENICVCTGNMKSILSAPVGNPAGLGKSSQSIFDYYNIAA